MIEKIFETFRKYKERIITILLFSLFFLGASFYFFIMINTIIFVMNNDISLMLSFVGYILTSMLPIFNLIIIFRHKCIRKFNDKIIVCFSLFNIVFSLISLFFVTLYFNDLLIYFNQMFTPIFPFDSIIIIVLTLFLSIFTISNKKNGREEMAVEDLKIERYVHINEFQFFLLIIYFLISSYLFSLFFFSISKIIIDRLIFNYVNLTILTSIILIPINIIVYILYKFVKRDSKFRLNAPIVMLILNLFSFISLISIFSLEKDAFTIASNNIFINIDMLSANYTFYLLIILISIPVIYVFYYFIVVRFKLIKETTIQEQDNNND